MQAPADSDSSGITWHSPLCRCLTFIQAYLPPNCRVVTLTAKKSFDSSSFAIAGLVIQITKRCDLLSGEPLPLSLISAHLGTSSGVAQLIETNWEAISMSHRRPLCLLKSPSVVSPRETTDGTDRSKSTSNAGGREFNQKGTAGQPRVSINARHIWSRRRPRYQSAMSARIHRGPGANTIAVAGIVGLEVFPLH